MIAQFEGEAWVVGGVNVGQAEGRMAELFGDDADIDVLRVHAVFAHKDIAVGAAG